MAEVTQKDVQADPEKKCKHDEMELGDLAFSTVADFSARAFEARMFSNFTPSIGEVVFRGVIMKPTPFPVWQLRGTIYMRATLGPVKPGQRVYWDYPLEGKGKAQVFGSDTLHHNVASVAMGCFGRFREEWAICDEYQAAKKDTYEEFQQATARFVSRITEVRNSHYLGTALNSAEQGEPFSLLLRLGE